jgi:dTDP-glucose pyrophosphorylase
VASQGLKPVWGIIPAAGNGTRIQPLAFSKELLPVGSRSENGVERPRAVSEYLIDRMIAVGARKICFVISPQKSDILRYFGAQIGPATLAYVIQPQALGLCDAIFRALPLIAPSEGVVVGLPDTIWFPEDGLCELPSDVLSFLLFPVERPELFDAVVTDPTGRVTEIRVKHKDPRTRWVWGAIRMPGAVLHGLYRLWCARDREDEFLGTLVNAWLREGHPATAVRAGTSYVDVGTLNGYREALTLLQGSTEPAAISLTGLDACPGSSGAVLPVVAL